MSKIKVKAMCLIVEGDRILVADGNSMRSNVRKVIGGNFYRVLGGGINFDEDIEDAVRREIREEILSEIEDLQRIGDVIINRFTYAGERGHEIVFMYKGKISNPEILNKDAISIKEDDYEFDAVWVPIKDVIKGEKSLYPPFDYGRYL